jgi:hypothetical protein
VLGPKAEATIARMITSIDGIIQPQDVMLLQFAYSVNFEWLNFGSSITNLLKKFVSVFGPSIDNKSLRHAILAWAAAFQPFSSSQHECIERHSIAAAKAIVKKTLETIDEADLFATVMLTILYASPGTQDISKFGIHVRGFVAVMSVLSQKSRHKGYNSELFKFWPLALDLIQERSRQVFYPVVRDYLIELNYHCNALIGPQNLVRRINYLTEFYGVDPKHEYAFSQSVWCDSLTLRLCFRETVKRQLGGQKGMDETISSLVSNLKAGLGSRQIREIAKNLWRRRSRLDWGPLDIKDDLLMFSLLVYQFCEHLILLMDSRTILEGTTSHEVVQSALLILRLSQQPEWLLPVTSYSYFPRKTATDFVPRMLWIAGLSLRPDDYSEGA